MQFLPPRTTHSAILLLLAAFAAAAAASDASCECFPYHTAPSRSGIIFRSFAQGEIESRRMFSSNLRFSGASACINLLRRPTYLSDRSYGARTMVDSGANECRQQSAQKRRGISGNVSCSEVKGCKKGNARKESLLFGMTIRAGGCVKQ